MTDKVQKIRKELARLKEETSIGLSEQENGVEQGRMEILNALSIFLDSMQDEPVSEDLEEAIEQSFIYHENRGDDFRMDEQMETTYRYGFETGAKWKEEQMMKSAITAHCFGFLGFQDAAVFSFKLPAGNYLVGSEVKVIVIKED